MTTPIKFNTLRKTTVHFLNTLNDITVDKHDKEGNVIETVDVPLKLAPKQKFYYWLYHREHNKRFPMMGASVTSIAPAIEHRAVNQKLRFTSKDKQYQLQYPTPYDLDFELNIVTKYIDEANQILEQILPWYQPYRMVTINLPEINETFDVKINLESVSEDKSFDMPEDENRTLSWTLSFVAHTWIYKPIYDSKLIEEIHLNYYNYVNENLLQRTITTEDGVEIYSYENLDEIEE